MIANSASGLYDFRGDLIKKLVSLGNNVYASIPANECIEELESIGCQIIDTSVDRRGINPIKDLNLILNYHKILKRIKPDIVITYTIKPNIYAGFICSIAHIPYAINITGLGTTFQNDGLLKKLVTLMYKFASKKAKVVYFENIGNLKTFIDLGIVKKEQTQLLNGAGVNLEKFSFKEYPRINERIKFLFIGRVMAEKGVNELFEAMKRLYNDGYSFELDILGYYEEDYEGHWKKGDEYIEYVCYVEGHGVNSETGELIDFITSQTGL